MDKSVQTKSWRSQLAGATALIALACVPGAQAWAQAGGGGTGGSGGPGLEQIGPNQAPPGAPPQQQVTPPAPTPEPDVLLGDLGGIRSRLLNEGVNLQLSLTGEFAGNISGTNVPGQSNSTRYAQQLAFSSDIDWDKLAGVPGFNTHFVVINRAGRNLSTDVIGDHISQAQEIYGAGFDVGFHNVYVYAEEKLFDDRLNIALGHWPLLTDFATSTVACVPIALTPGCGNPRVLDNQAAGTNWPQSSWGGRVRYRITPDIYVQAGVWQVVPFPAGGRTGWNWFQGPNTGVTIPAEIGYEPVFGPNQLTGHYKLGMLWDSSVYPDLFYSNSGIPLPFLPFGLPASHHGRTTVYGVVDQMLMRNGPGKDQGLIIMASAGYGSSNTIFNDATAFIQVLDTGFIPSRPNDTVSLSAGWYGISTRVAQLQSLELELGQPTFNGVNGPQRNEYVFEASYTAHVWRGVQLQPAVEYFVNPNAQTNLKNAVVFAGRINVNF
jgi:porin